MLVHVSVIVQFYLTHYKIIQSVPNNKSNIMYG